MRKILFTLFITTILSFAAFAQYAPSDVSDLIGERASGAERDLRDRGYVSVRNNKSNNRSFTNWWNGNRGVCIIVATYDGRFESISGAVPADCGRSNNNNNGGGWGNNNSGWNGSKSRPPSWARGTFYGTAPDGSQITMAISDNGDLTATVGGSPSYGGYNNGYIYINGASARVTRNGDGFVTVRNDNGERINYSRNGWGNGNNGGGWNGNNNNNNNNGSRPPSWARGTFYGTAPNGTQIQLTINDNGSATAMVGGSPSYGTYSNGTLVINGVGSRLERNGEGFVTIRNDNGERIYYGQNRWSNNGNSGNNEPMPNLIDLIGVRSAQGDAEARNRGFRIVDTNRDGNRTLKTMWRERSRQCYQVTVVDDQYLHVYDIQTHSKCR